MPMTYSTMDNGSAPYSKKVTIAPSTVPAGLVASARAIISTTYIQAMVTRYMGFRTGSFGARMDRTEAPATRAPEGDL
ncbi:hypothetical protein ASC87_21520 [Rhizobacter sp. Root1221]|nr:hypothetical protein ASC87_21520 [Rhizobacter sp. Root1221]